MIIDSPKKYCEQNGISTKDFVRQANMLGATKYNKSIHSFASNPDYGVCLRPEIEEGILKLQEVKKEFRRRPCRINARLFENDKKKFERALQLTKKTMQEAIEEAVRTWTDKELAKEREKYARHC